MGRRKCLREVIEEIDEENKSVCKKVIEGDVMKFFKSISIKVHVDKKGEDNLVTWTFTYEKLNENVEDPNTLMEVCVNVTKDIETHHLKPCK